MAATRRLAAGGVRRGGGGRRGRPGPGRLPLLREPAEAPGGPDRGGRAPNLAHRPGRTGHRAPPSRLRLPGRPGRDAAAPVGRAPRPRRQRRRGRRPTRPADARRVDLRDGESTRVHAGRGLAGGPRVPDPALRRPFRTRHRSGRFRRRVPHTPLRRRTPRSELLPASGDRRGTASDGQLRFLPRRRAGGFRATPDPRHARRTRRGVRGRGARTRLPRRVRAPGPHRPRALGHRRRPGARALRDRHGGRRPRARERRRRVRGDAVRAGARARPRELLPRRAHRDVDRPGRRGRSPADRGGVLHGPGKHRGVRRRGPGMAAARGPSRRRADLPELPLAFARRGHGGGARAVRGDDADGESHRARRRHAAERHLRCAPRPFRLSPRRTRPDVGGGLRARIGPRRGRARAGLPQGGRHRAGRRPPAADRQPPAHVLGARPIGRSGRRPATPAGHPQPPGEPDARRHPGSLVPEPVGVRRGQPVGADHPYRRAQPCPPARPGLRDAGPRSVPRCGRRVLRAGPGLGRGAGARDRQGRPPHGASHGPRPPGQDQRRREPARLRALDRERGAGVGRRGATTRQERTAGPDGHDRCRRACHTRFRQGFRAGPGTHGVRGAPRGRRHVHALSARRPPPDVVRVQHRRRAHDGG